MVVKHGSRVRIRLLNFSKDVPHSLHLDGNTFWVTGLEGAQQPVSAWQVRNTVAAHVGLVFNIEFIANNLGDWPVYCQMAQHIMNFVPRARTVGPRIRERWDLEEYRKNMEGRPPAQFPHRDPGFRVPGYPQQLSRQGFTEDEVKKLLDRREVAGMREGWYKYPMSLMTIVRVLPEDLYDRVMNGDEEIKPGEIYNEIVKRVKKRRAKES
jgi:hypothetical protein